MIIPSGVFRTRWTAPTLQRYVQGGCDSMKCHLDITCCVPSSVVNCVSPRSNGVTSCMMCHSFGVPLRAGWMSHEKALNPRSRNAIVSACDSSQAIKMLMSCGCIICAWVYVRAGVREAFSLKVVCGWAFQRISCGNSMPVLLYRLFSG